MPGEERSLEETPTWAVAAVFFVLVVVSLVVEHLVHFTGKWLTRRRKRALFEAFEVVKSELMLLGFVSLLLTVAQKPISNVSIPAAAADSWHPCNTPRSGTTDGRSGEDTPAVRNPTRLQGACPGSSVRQALARAGEGDHGEAEAAGKVPLISSSGIHELHIFIFVLAVIHVLYGIINMALGKLKMRSWRAWERQTKTVEYQFSQDPGRFRFARDTSFGQRHLSFWSNSPVLIWLVCFFRQFARSVTKADYLTLRHGFIMAHLAPQSSTEFDFHEYIRRSLEEDFKAVVGISPVTWLFPLIFLLFNTDGWYAYLWLPFIPLVIILLVGTKLQVIVTKMAIQIMERDDVVVRGVPVVHLTDHHFWFSRPRLLLRLIHFVLFQNAFELAFFIWSWYEYGLNSCLLEDTVNISIRISMGILVQILCSHVTLPLYALVTQMGSNMKTTIFDERVAAALRRWHQAARKHVKESRRSGSVTPPSTTPATPAGGFSPVHLLRCHRAGRTGTPRASPPFYASDNDRFDPGGSSHRQHLHLHPGVGTPPAAGLAGEAKSVRKLGTKTDRPPPAPPPPPPPPPGPQEEDPTHHQAIDIWSEISFDKRQLQ